MESLLTRLAYEKLSSYAAVILMFTYTFLLGRDFECSCKNQSKHCHVYLLLPVLIIFLLILWTNRSFKRVCRYLCSGSLKCCKPTTCNFCGSFFRHFFKAVLVSLLWVAFVYLDGDWYLCCKNDGSEQAPLACKAKDKITEKEKETIAELRNTSRVYGGTTLCVIVVVAFLIPFCRKCCEGKQNCCNRGFPFQKLILEEEANVMKEILRKSAKDQLTEEVKDRIRGGQWEKCFNVAVDLIDDPANPTISEEQQPLQEQTAKNMKDQSSGLSTGLELQVKKKDNKAT